MAKFNNYKRPSAPAMGGMGNMQELMKQAEKMQADLAKAKEEIAETELTGASGGGACKITLTGDKKLVNISIDESIVDKDDVEMLEDLIMAAYNEAYDKAEKLTESKIPQGMGGLI